MRRWLAWLWRRLSDFGTVDLLAGLVGGWKAVANAMVGFFAAGVAIAENLRLWEAILIGLGAFAIGCVALAALTLAWRALRSPREEHRSAPRQIAASAPSAEHPAKRPSLFSLFMTDFQPDMSWNAKFPCELEAAGQKVDVDVFYRILDDFTANAKYVAFYVPKIFVPNTEPSTQAVQILAHIAGEYPRFIRDIQEKRWAEQKSLGSPDVRSTKDTVFSGRVFIYHADDLAVEKLSALKALFQKNGAAPWFRGMDYASASWQSILLGERKPPPEYEVRDGWPRIVGETTPQEEQS